MRYILCRILVLGLAAATAVCLYLAVICPGSLAALAAAGLMLVLTMHAAEDVVFGVGGWVDWIRSAAVDATLARAFQGALVACIGQRIAHDGLTVTGASLLAAGILVAAVNLWALLSNRAHLG